MGIAKCGIGCMRVANREMSVRKFGCIIYAEHLVKAERMSAAVKREELKPSH